MTMRVMAMRWEGTTGESLGMWNGELWRVEVMRVMASDGGRNMDNRSYRDNGVHLYSTDFGVKNDELSRGAGRNSFRRKGITNLPSGTDRKRRGGHEPPIRPGPNVRSPSATFNTPKKSPFDRSKSAQFGHIEPRSHRFRCH